MGMVKPLNIYMAGYAGHEACNNYFRGLLPESVTLHWTGESLDQTVERIWSADFIRASITYEKDDVELADVSIAEHLSNRVFLTLPEHLTTSDRKLPQVHRIIRVDSGAEAREALLETIVDLAEKTPE
jgi:hypothetical protein